MNNTVITCKNLKKRFNDTYVLKGINLKIDKGFNAVIGPNGAGKSVFFRILLGGLYPSQGEARFFGYDCWSESYKIREKLGAMIEDPSYPGSISCEDYLSLIFKLRNIPRSGTFHEVPRLLKLVDLYDEKSKVINKFSSGMKKKLAFIAAIIGEPEFLLLDEPLANLDVIMREKVKGIIKDYCRDNRSSVLMSTHVISDINNIADKYIIMHEGEADFLDDLKIKRLLRSNKLRIVSVNVSLMNILLESDKVVAVQKDNNGLIVEYKGSFDDIVNLISGFDAGAFVEEFFDDKFILSLVSNLFEGDQVKQ
ncbi:ABC transporter ATP-binding protein [Candidatus Bathyarchaeota archaeon]|nr:ABC transporter ATP-binding protein [Candidatus Bathyarchaeota archaeon]